MGTMKVIGVVFLGLVIIASMESCRTTVNKASPEGIAVQQKNQAELALAQQQRQTELDELSGAKCTKDKKAHLGESTARTLKCGWGKPQKINRSTYQFGTREQWVYGDGNYLYFHDGILNSIQN